LRSPCRFASHAQRRIASGATAGLPSSAGTGVVPGSEIDHCSRADRKDSCPPRPRARREHYLPVLDSFYPAGITAFSPGVASLRATLGCGEPEPSTLQGLDPRGLTCGVDSASSALEMPATLSELTRWVGIRVPRVVAARQPWAEGSDPLWGSQIHNRKTSYVRFRSTSRLLRLRAFARDFLLAPLKSRASLASFGARPGRLRWPTTRPERW